MAEEDEDKVEDQPEPTVDSMGRPYIPMAKLAEHSSNTDLWMAINNKVYNVTEYMDEHPGGEEVLMDKAGMDATMEFEDVGHSNDARNTLAKFMVGELPPSERNVVDGGGGGAGGGASMTVMLLLPLILAIGAGYYFYGM